MPTLTTEIPAEVAVRYKNVTIYHVYRNDDVGQGKRTFWFTLSPYGGETTGEAFDVRDLAEWEPVGAASEDEHVRDVLKKAIGTGTITSPAFAEDAPPCDSDAARSPQSVVAALVAAAYGRGDVDATLPELLSWAEGEIDEDLLWDTLGPLVDDIERRAQRHFGATS